MGLFLHYLKIVLAYAAKGANPVVGDILKCCSGLDATFGVAHFGVIDPTTNLANILLHSCVCFDVVEINVVLLFITHRVRQKFASRSVIPA